MALNWKALGLAIGIIWGLCVLLIGWAAAWTGWGDGLVTMLGSLYIGYAPSPVGGLIGGAWAFVDGIIGGALVALLYNRLEKV